MPDRVGHSKCSQSGSFFVPFDNNSYELNDLLEKSIVDATLASNVLYKSLLKRVDSFTQHGRSILQYMHDVMRTDIG